MRVASEYPLSCWRCGFQSSSCKLPPQPLGDRSASASEGCLMSGELRYHDPQLQQLQMMNCGKVQRFGGSGARVRRLTKRREA